MFDRLLSKLKGHYFTIGIRETRESGTGRVFYIEKVKAKNPLRYVHEIRGFIFMSEDDCDKAIIKKLENEHGEYTDLDGYRRLGVKAYRYKTNEKFI